MAERPKSRIRKVSDHSEPLIDYRSFSKQLESLVRGDGRHFQSCIVTHELDISVPDTRALAHVFHLGVDGNGRPNSNLLARHLVHSIIEYAIPRDTCEEALESAKDSNDLSKIASLYEQAKRLFNHLDRTGEPGELLLFVLAEQSLGIPQLFTKMSLKTSSKMHFQGSDGVHASYCEESQSLRLHFCESKLYGDFISALREALDSAAAFLLEQPDGSTDNSHELYLMRQHLTLNDPELESVILRFLDPGDSAFQHTELCLILLIGFDSNVYDHDTQTTLDLVRDAINELLPGWISSVTKGLKARTLDTFQIDTILFPFDDVTTFRSAFLAELGATS